MWNKLTSQGFLELPKSLAVIIPTRISCRMQLLAIQSRECVENGGIILGRIKPKHVEICTITSSFSQDLRSANSFIRKAPEHIKTWQKLNILSNHSIGYIGEWHTHREEMPTPSACDVKSWNQLILSSPDHPRISIIAGYDGCFCF